MSLIYVVEDDINISEIESFALKNVGYEVECFGTAGAFYQALKGKRPDLVLLDIMLPDEDGLSIVSSIRKNAAVRNVPIIMITAKSSEIDKVKGLDIGADDYMTKPFGIMELISRVKALLRRYGHMKAEDKLLSLGSVTLDKDKHAVCVDGRQVELTYKEFELLHLLLANAGIVTPRDRILEKVWGMDFEGESRTLDMHIKTLRQKLGQAGSMIKTVRNVGYFMSEE